MKQKEQNFLKFFLIGLLIVLFILLGQHFNFYSGFESLIQNLANPVKNKIYLSLGQKKLNQESIDTQSVLRKLAEIEAENSSLKKENEAMKKLLGSPLPPEWQFLSAKILGLSSADYLQIDKGAADKVKDGSAVVFENNYLGQISSISPHFSQVLLPTSGGAKVLAIVKDQNGQVLAKGILGGKDNRIYLDKVLMKEKLEIGSLVLTAGDKNLPSDIPIGRIEKVTRNEDEVYQQAQVKTLIDPKTLNFVFIVTQ